MPFLYLSFLLFLGFPNEPAAVIALNTIKEWLTKNHNEVWNKIMSFFNFWMLKVMVFDSKTVKRVNTGLRLEVFYYLVFRPVKSGQDNIARGRFLYLKALLEFKGNTFVWNHTVHFLCIVVFPGKAEDYSLPQLFLSVRIFG